MVYTVFNKWRIAKKVKIGDYACDSKFEGSICQDLIFRKVAKEIKDFKTQQTIDLICNGFKIGTYRIDFIVWNNDDSITFLEAKGLPSPEWKMKWKILESMVETRHKSLIDIYGDKEFKMEVS
jgi:hypothetical protein